jgi:hypothetical protein
MSSKMLPATGPAASGYYGAGIYGFNSVVLEKMCPGLGEFAETIYSGFGTMFTKFMVYTANEAVFPLHRDGMLHQNLFRVPISLSEWLLLLRPGHAGVQGGLGLASIYLGHCVLFFFAADCSYFALAASDIRVLP